MIFYYSYPDWGGSSFGKFDPKRHYNWSIMYIIGDSQYRIEKVTI